MAIDFSLSPELEEIRNRVRSLVDEVVRPIEKRWDRNDRKQLIDGIVEMRTAAQERGLWLPHMPEEWGGMGLGHVELAMVQAEAARTSFGPFAINAQAPDEGNMHTLLHWGTEEQKQKYLKPLCEGTSASCFAMTEPEVAGSDPTLIKTWGYPDGDEWVINGHKWFISNAHRARFAILICAHRGRARHPAGREHRVHRRPPAGRLDRGARDRDDARPRTVTPRSASKTCACTTTRCSAGAGRVTCSASTASGRPGSRTACAGSRRPRRRST